MTMVSLRGAQRNRSYLRVGGMLRARARGGAGGREHPPPADGGNVPLHPAFPGGRQGRAPGHTRAALLQSGEYRPRRLDHDDARHRHGACRPDDAFAWRNLSVTRNHRQICPPDIGRFRCHARHRPGGSRGPDRHHARGQDRGHQRQAPRSWHVDMPHCEQEAMMIAVSIVKPTRARGGCTNGFLRGVLHGRGDISSHNPAQRKQSLP